MKITLDFTKAHPTAKQIEYACAIHRYTLDGVSDKEFAKICSSSIRTAKYITEHQEAYRRWCFTNQVRAELTYNHIMRMLGLPLDPEF